MKSLLLAAVAFFGITVSQANAQMPPSTMVNCAALHGSPMMCVKNETQYPIVGIQATTNVQFGTEWITIPGGPIAPGGTSIVRFPIWGFGCLKFVTIKTANGMTHTYPNVDVCQSTSFNVRSW